MKRKFITVILAVLLIAQLAGCGGSPAPASSAAPAPAPAASAAPAAPAEPAKPAAPQKIVLWHSMSDDAGVLMEKFVKDFNEGPGKEKQITVESVFQGAYADSTTKMRTILQNSQYDQLPDVMQIDATGVVDYKTSGKAYTIDDALAKDKSYDIKQIVDAPLKAWNYGGVQLGMPFSSSTSVMYYNKTLLDAAGVTTPPSTFAEISALAAKLPKKTADGAALIAYSQVPNTPTLANWIGQIKGKDANASYVVDNRNGRDGSATKLVCDTDGTLLTFLTEWKNMYTAGAVANKGSGLSDMFFAGQLALYTTSTSNLNTLLETINGKFELGCANYPRVNADANYGATISGSAMFMFNKGDQGKADAAWEFIKYLSSPQVQAEFSTGTGYFPNNTGAYETDAYKAHVAKYPQFEVGVEQVAATSPDMMGVTVGPSRDFYMEIQNVITAMLEQNMTPADTVTEMSDVLNGLLDQYKKANS